MRLKPLPTGKRNNRRYDDLLGLLGGVFCVVMSLLDPAWSDFWFIAGAVLLLWAAGSFVYSWLKR